MNGEDELHLILTSDLHGHLPAIEDCDLLLIAGDLAPLGLTHGEQKEWSETTLKPWVSSVGAKSLVWIAGNHDPFVLRDDFVPKRFPFYLQEREVDALGLKIYGFPWVAQERDGLFYLDKEEMQKRIERIPSCDILLSHAPPLSVLDLYTGGEEPELCGLPGLLEETEAKVELFTLSGHIHEGFGLWPKEGPRIINASYVDQKYQPREEMFSAVLRKNEEQYFLAKVEKINVPL